jgi:type II secretory pathway predicted ATPase ExeA
VYETHFGLAQCPFSETVNPAAYIAVPSRDAVLRRLRYSIERSQGPAVLFGPAGSGKTILSRRLASDLHIGVVHITFPALSAAELLTHLAQEFGGLPAPPRSLADALYHVRAHLGALAARRERVLLIVDDAHLIDTAGTFEALRLLLNFTTDGPSNLSLLLVGGTEVLLGLPAALGDRLAARCLLAPFAEAESSMYILGRLTAAGATSPLFTEAALAALHHSASGSPRRLNHLADMALLIAFAQDLPAADELTVSSAAREFVDDLAA